MGRLDDAKESRQEATSRGGDSVGCFDGCYRPRPLSREELESRIMQVDYS